MIKIIVPIYLIMIFLFFVTLNLKAIRKYWFQWDIWSVSIWCKQWIGALFAVFSVFGAACFTYSNSHPCKRPLSIFHLSSAHSTRSYCFIMVWMLVCLVVYLSVRLFLRNRLSDFSNFCMMVEVIICRAGLFRKIFII